MHETPADMRTRSEDLELLEQVLEGSSHAWVTLLRSYRALIYRCITKATSRVGACVCSDDLDDIFSEFCLNLVRDDMKKLRAFDPERGVKVSTWLGMLAINSAYDYLRKRARFPLLASGDEVAPEPASGDPDALDQVLARERHAQLGALVSRLSGRDRSFVHLFYDAGLEPEEVARVMAISVKTVYTKKHKIRARLVALAAEQQLSLAA